MPKYEYKYTLAGEVTHGQLLPLMNTLGQEGWRVVQVFETEKGFFGILTEREIPQEKPWEPFTSPTLKS